MATENFTNKQRTAIILLRMLIGWHFLYEGAIKLFNPGWTAKFYLLSSEGLFKSFFFWLAGDGMIGIVDFLNVACLIMVGLALILGIFERVGASIGIALLILYYFAHPAFPGLAQAGTEGSYFLINKNLIEAAALYLIFLCPTAEYFGLTRYLKPSTLTTSNV